jgi:xanthine dehydrogenase molybdenum-binding subunit
MEGKKFQIVGQVTPRKDGVARVTGQETYTVDVKLPRMLYGRTVCSPYAHARIKSIDTSLAEAMGAVVLTFKDIPQVRYNERIITVDWALHKDHYILADKVRRMGEAVAAVAAETEDLAERAVRAIKVEYEPLPVVLDPEAAMQPGAEPLYDTVIYGEKEIPVEHNIACTREVIEGDVDQAFAGADVFVEGTFKAHKVYHAQMEPKTVTCCPEPDGGITVWATLQSIHNARIVLSQIFGIPMCKVNIKRMSVGGTFGSSIQMNSVVPIGVALALKAHRPVKLSQTREEDMNDHGRFGTETHIKIGAKKDGTLVGVDMKLITDIGAHLLQGYSFLGVSIGWVVSLYNFPNVRYEGICVYTNKAPGCAMQGFGNPQATLAVESLIDELAEKLGMDPIELRLKNYVGLGMTFWGQGPLVRSLVWSDGVPELLGKGMELIGWNKRQPAETKTGRYRKGIGMARGFHTSSGGAPQPGDVIDYSGAMVKINQDGSVDVISAVVDHGGGTLEAMAKLVAETLCVPLGMVNVVPTDTFSSVYDVATHATRGIYAGAGAAVKVAKEVKQEIYEAAARYLNVQPESLEMKIDPALGQGVIYVPSIPDKHMTLKQVASRCWTESWKTIAKVDSYRPVACPPAYVTVFVEVEVDTWTGKVRTLRTALGCDCGTVVNPDGAVGQLEGGLSRGAGMALYEDIHWDTEGMLTSRGLWIDSKVPGIMESPCLGDLTTHFAHTYEPTGPLGAKGIGEAALNPVPAAYASAIYNATGIRSYELPITPEKILMELMKKESSATVRSK